jgi:hypothetical protein
MHSRQDSVGGIFTRAMRVRGCFDQGEGGFEEFYHLRLVVEKRASLWPVRRKRDHNLGNSIVFAKETLHHHLYLVGALNRSVWTAYEGPDEAG